VTRTPGAAEVSLVSSNERTRTVLVDELVAGTSAPHALIACVRTLTHHGNFAEARRLTRAARAVPQLREAARATAAVTALAQGRLGAAGDRVRGLSRASALRLVPAELVAAEFAEDHATAVTTAASLVDGSAELGPEDWLELARQIFAGGEPGLTEQALDRIRSGREPVPTHVDAEVGWLERWIARARADHEPGPVPEGQVAVAVLDYKLPDYRRASANVGDYIQTVASLGHLVRHPDLRFNGDADLAAQLTALQARVRPDDRRAGVKRDVTAVAVNRDASSLDAIPEGTWMLAFGWYMHDWFRVRYDFPFHPHLRPLFVSFHVNRPQVLSEEGVAYLRKHAPIGCRDWATVHRLLGLEIPAFFSGCLTSTVALLFPGTPPRPAAEAPVALVDLPPGTEPPNGRDSTRLSHASAAVREAGLPANIGRAVETLEAYRRDFSAVLTSRLHCYLPSRALGVDVEFQPKREEDTRFEGLIGIDDAAFEAMDRGIRQKLEVVLGSILRGDDEQTVRATWRDICAPDVEAARLNPFDV
jgi:hypothetical protein